MRDRSRRWIWVPLLVILPSLPACSEHDSHATHNEHPAQVERIDGSGLSRVTLTERAVERIGLETVSIREEQLSGLPSAVVPYSSLIYDPQGRTWIYTSPQLRTFVRLEVDVDRIEGDRVFLRNGPPVGTVVASVGVAELYGTEFKVGH
jgi:hypothetical protein